MPLQAVMLWLLAQGPVVAQGVDGFYPRPDGAAVLAQPLSSGEIWVGGVFDGVAGTQRPHLARVVEDGRLDDSFRPEVDDDVICVAELADGSLLVGGSFTTIQGTLVRPHLARLTRTGTNYGSFDAGVNGRVNSIVVQPDGMILVAGQFTEVDGQVRNRLARIDANGNVDAAFDPNVDGAVYAMALQLDGSILIGGSFQNVGGVARSRVARVLPDGSVDPAFDPAADGTVSCLVVQPDGKILAGGLFYNIGGAARSCIARLESNGVQDAGFSGAADNWVDSIALQADGSMIIGGEFTGVNGSGRNRIAKLNAAGVLDAGFNPGAGSAVRGLALQEDGKVLVAGLFRYIDGQHREGLARVNNTPAATQVLSVTGTSQIDWQRGGSAPVLERVWFEHSEAGLQGANWTYLGEGQRVAGGWRLDGLSLSASGRVRVRGCLPGGWFNGSSSLVDEVVTYGGGDEPQQVVWREEPVDSSNYISVSPGYTHDFGAVEINNNFDVNSQRFRISEIGGVNRLHVLRHEIVGPAARDFIGGPWSGPINPSGLEDFTVSFRAKGAGPREATLRIWTDDFDGSPFEIGLTGYGEALQGVYNGPSWFPVAIVPEETGGAVLAGGFLNYGYYAANRMVRINQYGLLDTNFTANIDDGVVYAVVHLENGQYLIGGSFTSVDGVARQRLALLNADGSLDPAFNPGADDTVYSLGVQPDGKILVTGAFTNVAGAARSRVARLNGDGSLDAGFNAGANSSVICSLILPDGDILLGGSFTAVNGTARTAICKVDSNGVLDASYNPAPNNTVLSMARQADGEILIGGYFTGVGGYGYARMCRLHADGTPDFGFRCDVDDYVASLTVQADGRILVAGAFDTVGGVPRAAFARIQQDGSLDTAYQPEFDAADTVYAAALSPNGLIRLAGNFNLVSKSNLSLTVNYYAEFENDTAAGAVFESPAAGVLSLVQTGSAPLADQVKFETWNGTGWTDHGLATPTADGWSMSGLLMESGGWARGSGRTSGSYYSSSNARITVEGGYGTLVPDIAVTNPSGGAGGYHFGEEQWLTAGDDQTFTISNQGTAELNNLSVLMSGNNPDDFNLTQPLVTSLAPGESTTFTCNYAPLGVGSRSAYIDVISNDYDELPKRMSVTGTSVIPPDIFTPVLDTNGYVYATAVQPDGYVLVGGQFSEVDGQSRVGLARFTPDGDLDTSFFAGISATSGIPSVESIVVQPDGKILICGNFTYFNGQARPNLARLMPDGSLDSGFVPPFTILADAMALQPDGKVICRALPPSQPAQLVRLMPDGSQDAGFAGSSIGPIQSIAVQQDGKVLVATGGTVLRKLEDGTADGSFGSVVANSTVSALLVESGGRIVIGGSFTTVNGTARNRMARLESTGTLDAGYDPNVNNQVIGMAPQANGKVIIGGSFSVVGGTTRQRVAKLNPDGTLDASFDPGATHTVHAVAVQPDGRVLVGGLFTQIAGSSQRYIARVPNNEVAASVLSLTDTSQIDWVRAGATSGLSAVVFSSWNGAAWDDLGEADWTGTSWRMTGLSLPADGWVRAVGQSRGGNESGSASLVEQVKAYGNAVSSSPDIAVVLGGEVVESGAGAPVVFDQQDWLTSSPPKVFTVTNDGAGSLELASVVVGGAFASDYLLTPPGQMTLAPGASTAIEVVFHPQGAGVRGAELRITCNDPDESVFVIKLDGYGMHRDPDFYPDFMIQSSNHALFSAIEEGGGNLLAGGSYSQINGLSTGGHLVRFDTQGQLDLDFRPNASIAYATSIDHDGSVLSMTNGRELKRYNAVSGALDAGFVPGFSGSVKVNTILPLLDGRMLIGGDFGAEKLLMLNADGSLASFASLSFNSEVTSIIRQADGKFVVAGLFTTVNGGSWSGVIRLHPNGAHDGSFSSASTGPTHTIVTAADGKIYGSRNGLIYRLNPNGTMDGAFNVMVRDGSSGANVFSMAPQADGSLIVVGDFTSIGGQPRQHVARVLANGSIDPLFNPGTSGSYSIYELGEVHGVTLRADGRVVLTGAITEAGGVPRNCLAQLPNNVAAVNTPVLTSATQMDWQQSGSAPCFARVWVERWDGTAWVNRVDASVVAGGWRATGLSLPGSGWVRVVGQTRCGRYNGSYGQVEHVLTYGGGGLPELTVEKAGGIAVESAGELFDFGDVAWPQASAPMVFTIRNTGSADLTGFALERLLGNVLDNEVVVTPPPVSVLAPGATTTFSVSFNPVTPGVRTFTLGLLHGDAEQLPFKLQFSATADYGGMADWQDEVPSTSTLQGFTMFRQADGGFIASGGHRYFGRLLADGSLDEGFATDGNNRINGMIEQPDGSMIVWGFFSTLGGVSQPYLARMHPDGSVDPSFAPTINSSVYSAAVDDQGRILIGGQFSVVNGVTRNRLARLHPDGTLDTGFDPNVDSTVYSLMVMADGDIYLGGAFFNVGGVARNFVARINDNGTLDAGFPNLQLNSTVYSLGLDHQGELLIGGSFTTIAGTPVSKFIRVSHSGVLDAGFSGNGVNNLVHSFAAQANGKIVAGGGFSWLVQQPNTYWSRLLRIETDGSLDMGFNPQPQSTINGLAIEVDGSLSLAGGFYDVGGVPNRYLQHLPADEPAGSSLVADGSRIEWQFTGSHPVPQRVYLESWNGTSWVAHGVARAGATFSSNGLSIPVNGWVRARGWLPCGYYNNSGRWLEVVQAYGEAAVADLTVESPPGNLVVTGGVLDFGDVESMVAAVPQTVLLRNDGGLPLTGLSVAVTGDHAADFVAGAPGLTTLNPGESTTFTVNLTPSVIGPRMAALEITSSDADETPVVLDLTGVGIRALALESPVSQPLADGGNIDFGEVQWPVSGVSRTVVIRNDGTAAVSGIGAVVTGSGAAAYQLTGPALTTLNPGEQTTVEVVFDTVQAGSSDAVLEIVSSEAPGTPLLVNLTGQCIYIAGGAYPQLNNQVMAVAPLKDGSMLVGGYFSAVSGEPRANLARFAADGSLAAGYQADFTGGAVHAVAVLADGRVLVGGEFDSVNGVARCGLVLLDSAGNVEPTFDAGLSLAGNPASASVRAVLVMPDGRIVVGGQFDEAGGQVRQNLARFDADGVLDAAYAPDPSGLVHALALQPDGRLLVAGGFTGIAGSGQARVARLNDNGSHDATFAPTFVGGSTVYDVIHLANGDVLLGGDFSEINTVARPYLARLNSSAVLDGGFVPAVDGAVDALVEAADGSLLAGMRTSTGSQYLLRLASDGTVDADFAPLPTAQVYALALASDGAIWVGGNFNQIGGVASQKIARLDNDTVATSVLTSPTPGELEWLRGGSSPELSDVLFELWDGSTWQPLAAGSRVSGGWNATGLTIAADALVRARGRTESHDRGWMLETHEVGSPGVPVLTLLDAGAQVVDGSHSGVDFGTATGVDEVFTIRNDGNTQLVGITVTLEGVDAGEFTITPPGLTSLAPGATTTVAVRYAPGSWGAHAASLRIEATTPDEGAVFIGISGSNGGVEGIPVPVGTSTVYSSLELPNGELLLATHGSIKWLAADGTLLRSITTQYYVSSRWSSGYYNSVSSGMALQDDGKILLVGHFDRLFNGSTYFYRKGMARFNPDGSYDESFNAALNVNRAYSVLVQPDGKLLVGGQFTDVAGVSRPYLARLEASGALDSGFVPDPSAASSLVYAMALQQDGRILVAKSNVIERFTPDGTLDATFNCTLSGVAYSMVRFGSQWLVGGGFTQVNGEPRAYLAMLNDDGSLDPTFTMDADTAVMTVAATGDGKAYVGGNFTTIGGEVRSRLARLNADGSLDAGYQPEVNGMINSVVPELDGRVTIAGGFNTIDGVSTPLAARLLPDVQAVESLVVSGGNEIELILDGSAPVIESARLAYLSGNTWVEPALPVRTASGWKLSGVSLPSQGWVRARGRLSVGDSNAGSSKPYELIQPYGGGDFPDIAVIDGNALELMSGSDTLDFGQQPYPQLLLEQTLTIRNDGAGALTGLAFSVAGNAAGDYQVDAGGLASLLPGQQADITVRFAPVQTGVRLARLEIASNDADELPFIVHLSGDYPVDGLGTGADGAVYAVLPASDGSVLVGGQFVNIGGLSRSYVARILENGEVDPGFAPGANNVVYAAAEMDDGGFVIAGSFTQVGGLPRQGLAKLHADGTVDAGWSADVSQATGLLVMPDGRLLVTGNFSSIAGVGRQGVAVLHPDGSPDLSFIPPSWSYAWVRSAALLPDGRVLLAGSFNTGSLGSYEALGLVRLESNGTWDPSLQVKLYQSNGSPNADSVVLSADGSAWISGRFQQVNDQPMSRLARVLGDGSLDTGLPEEMLTGPSESGALSVQALQGGSLLMGGYFTSMAGAANMYLGVLDDQGQGDPAFQLNTNSSVYGVGLGGNGILTVGGGFTTIGGVARSNLGRTQLAGVETPVLDVVDASTVTWTRGAWAPGLQHVRFELDSGGGWVDLGPGVATQDGWQIAGLSLPSNGDVRVIGRGQCGYLSGSSMRVVEEVSFVLAPPDIVLSPDEVMENEPVATVVGQLALAVPAGTPPYSYTLVAGDGDADNGLFTIVGDELRTAVSFDQELKSSATIRVRVSDSIDFFFEEAVSITIGDDRSEDADEDGLTEAQEEDVHGTSDLTADSDGDQFDDGYEVGVGLDPSSILDGGLDRDGDQSPDWLELRMGTNPDVPNPSPVDSSVAVGPAGQVTVSVGPGAAGVGFQLDRSPDLDGSWIQVEDYPSGIVVGQAGDFVEPSPAAGRMFYRVIAYPIAP